MMADQGNIALNTSKWRNVGRGKERTKASSPDAPPNYIAQSPDNQKFYIKIDDSRIIASEMIANKLYELAGIPVPKQSYVLLEGGRVGLASHWVPDAQQLFQSPEEAEAATAETLPKYVGEGFGMDAWLGNYDVIGGTTLGNMHYRPGPEGPEAMRIDVGASMGFSGWGMPKPGQDQPTEHEGRVSWGDRANELHYMLDPELSRRGKPSQYHAALVYSKFQNDRLRESIQRLQAISDNDIDRIVYTYATAATPQGPVKLLDDKAAHAMAATLKARRNYILANYERVLAKREGEASRLVAWVRGRLLRQACSPTAP
jgi:hypothetical protein